MSYSAQGWAQRQTFGSPILKGVMQALCYLMRDDELTVWVAVTGGNKTDLERLTEYEERAIRKALQQLVELGFLQDTGQRHRNMVVWRLPRYEAWLARAESEASETTPPMLGSGHDSDPSPPAQAHEKTLEKSDVAASDDDPSRQGEGFPRETATPPVQGSDPSRLRSATPPVQGGQSSLDPRSTKPARATRLSDWRQQARVKLERAPDRPTKENPTALCRGHIRFWQVMVGWYGALWLHQFGDWPPIEWIRLLNLWNNSGKWAELDQVIGDLTLEKPEKPPTLPEIEERFRASAKAKGPAYDEAQSRTSWLRIVIGHAFASAHLFGLGPYGITSFDEIRFDVRERIRTKCRDLADRAIACEKEIPPRKRNVIEQIVTDELTATMRDLQAPQAGIPLEESEFEDA